MFLLNVSIDILIYKNRLFNFIFLFLIVFIDFFSCINVESMTLFLLYRFYYFYFIVLLCKLKLYIYMCACMCIFPIVPFMFLFMCHDMSILTFITTLKCKCTCREMLNYNMYQPRCSGRGINLVFIKHEWISLVD